MIYELGAIELQRTLVPLETFWDSLETCQIFKKESGWKFHVNWPLYVVYVLSRNIHQYLLGKEAKVRDKYTNM